MAASIDEQVKPFDTIRMREEMTSFPCMFNMPYNEHVSRSILRDALKCLLQFRDGVQSDEEQMKAGNMLTWVSYQLELHEEAVKENESVLILSNYESVVALGNYVFMEWQNNGRMCSHFKELESLRIKTDFKDKVASAKAEQANCLVKLGGLNNLKNAIQLYEESLAIKETDTWRYELGQSYRKLSFNSNGQIFIEKAKDCFQSLIGSSDKALQAQSLINLQAWNEDSHEDKRNIIEKAVSDVPNCHEVCLIAGREMMYIPGCIDRAVELLEKSVTDRPSCSSSHNYLGNAYRCQLKHKNEKMRNEIQEKAKRHLRKAYDMSYKTRVSSLLDMARVLQGMEEKEGVKTETTTFLTSREAVRSSNLFEFEMAHMILFYSTPTEVHESERCFHLRVAMLVGIAGMKKNVEAKKNCELVWSYTFGNKQIFVCPNNTNPYVKSLCKNLHTNFLRHDSIIKNIKKLVSDETIDDIETITSMVNDIHRPDDQNEDEALLFLELVSLRPGLNVPDLRVKLLKRLAHRCLQRSLITSAIFFHQSFQLVFIDDQADENILEEEEINYDEVTKADIVMLFNESHSNTTTDTARGLEEVISTLFNLNMISNPLTKAKAQNVIGQGNGLTDCVHKHKPSLILIVFEGDGADNNYIWDQIASLYERTRQLDGVFKMPSVALIQCYDYDQQVTNLPSHVAKLPCLGLGREGDDAFINRFCLKEAHDQANASVDMAGVVKAYFGDNIEDVMTLFNHLTQNNNSSVPK